MTHLVIELTDCSVYDAAKLIDMLRKKKVVLGIRQVREDPCYVISGFKWKFCPNCKEPVTQWNFCARCQMDVVPVQAL